MPSDPLGVHRLLGGLFVVAVLFGGGLTIGGSGHPGVATPGYRSTSAGPHVFSPTGRPTSALPAPLDPRAAAPVLSWWNITSESSTPAPIFWFTQGTWDASDGYLMFYGGDNFTGTNLAQTWAYSAGNWRLVPTNTSPGGLDGPALAYDPSAGQVVMFGGVQSYSPFHSTNLTWFYSGGNWTSANLSPHPTARLAGSMVYDPDLGGLVLFGGYNNSDPSGGTLLNDLWLFKAGAWSRIAAVSPPTVRTWAPIAYDPGLHEVVLYSGVNVLGQCLGDTWTLTNTTWTHRHVPSGGPPTLCANALGYDPDLGRVVLTGGLNSTTGLPSNASWSFNGTAWLPLGATGAPGPHEYGVSAWDPVDHTYVVAGGWPAFTTTDVLSAPLTVVSVVGPATTEVGELTSVGATVIGGVPMRSYVWDWGDGTITPGDLNSTHQYAVPGQYTVSVTATDAETNVASANTSITVTPGPSVVIQTSSVVGDVGVPINFTAVVGGGASIASFVWTFGDGMGGTGPALQHDYATLGNFTVIIHITDPRGGTGTGETNVSIYRALAMQLVAPLGAEQGIVASFNATVLGGAPNVSYLWSYSDGGSSTSPTGTHAFTAVGPQVVALTVEDAANYSVTSQETVFVAAGLAVAAIGTTSLSAGSSGSWDAIVSGGMAPFHVQWTYPDGTTTNGTTGAFTFGSSGNFAVKVRVTDALGGIATANVTVTVTASSGIFGGSLGGVPTLAVAGAFVLVIVGALVAVVLLRRRSRQDPPDI
ncbi:MAG: PKD domain-containing protein [Thermoplasmata archaeon]|nr:PKD domain-containing protein [Thermoplasmata archaeon]